MKDDSAYGIKELEKVYCAGALLREPPGSEAGYWVGAPGAFFDEGENAWYLTYRLRRPRGVEPDRGGEARIARSTDLRNFEEVWRVRKDQFRTASMERASLRRGPDGQWHYYASFVDPADGRWCVEELVAAEIAGLDPARSKRLFSAGPLGLEGVKDPWVVEVDGRYYMFLSVAMRTPATGQESHATLDIFNTGDCISATGLAISEDLRDWSWQGVVFQPEGKGWDGYCRRLNSVIRCDDGYLGFYDGIAGAHENYEERTGLAYSPDLITWKSLTPKGPAWVSPHASGSLRYVEAREREDQVVMFFEVARADGAHELRMMESPRLEMTQMAARIRSSATG